MTPRGSRPGTKPATGTRLRSDQLRQIERARSLVTAADRGLDAVAGLLGCEGDTGTVYPHAFGIATERMRNLLAIVDDQESRDLKEWSNSDELCAWLGVSKGTLNWWNTTGQGPRRHRMGKGNRYRRGDVEKWLVTRLAPEDAGVRTT